MTSMLQAGPQLSLSEQRTLRAEAMFDEFKWDVRCEDLEVIADFPLLLEHSTFRHLSAIAEGLSDELFAAEQELLVRPELHRKLGLPKSLCRCLREISVEPSAGAARVLRFDFHPTRDGWRISEVNSDVPGGFIEAGALARRVARFFSGVVVYGDPACAYMRVAEQNNRQVALVLATPHSDDHQVMFHLARVLQRLGLQTSLVGPGALRWKNGRAEVSCHYAEGMPSVIVRFVPADWLRVLAGRESWKSYFRGSRTPLSNPGYALLTQSKRFPTVWDKLKTPLHLWRDFLPKTICPSSAPDFDSPEWVIKPALGRVGEDVAIRDCISRDLWIDVLRRARRHPHEWAVQERFVAIPIETPLGPMYPCLGFYTVNGKTAGVYGRVASKPLVDQDARDVAVLGLSEAGR